MTDKLNEAIQRAATELPIGASIEILVERDAGTVSLNIPSQGDNDPGEYICDFHGTLSEQVNDAVDYAIDVMSE